MPSTSRTPATPIKTIATAAAIQSNSLLLSLGAVTAGSVTVGAGVGVGGGVLAVAGRDASAGADFTSVFGALEELAGAPLFSGGGGAGKDALVSAGGSFFASLSSRPGSARSLAVRSFARLAWRKKSMAKQELITSSAA